MDFPASYRLEGGSVYLKLQEWAFKYVLHCNPQKIETARLFVQFEC